MRYLRYIFSALLCLLLVHCSGLPHNPTYITDSADYCIVRKGDTLSGIGKKYHLSVSELMRFNNLSDSTIAIGQKIYLSPRNFSQKYYITSQKIPKTKYHIVKKGETLYRIARLYNISLENLMKFNQLSTYTIQENQKLWLAKDAMPSSSKKSFHSQESPKSTLNKKFHVVQKGENLYRIASQYGLSVYAIKAYNNLTSDIIFVGQKLYLLPESNQTQRKKYLKKSSHNPAQKMDLEWPTTGIITSGFGLRNGKPHKGIDIANKKGTPIKAVLDGEIAYTGWQRGYGNVIIMKHTNGIMTVYAHNRENYVVKGDRIQKGTRIAAMGSTGNSTGSHLHFEYRIEGRAMNPLNYLPPR